MDKHQELSSLEIRHLLLDTLAYEGDDIDKGKRNFKLCGYRGSQNDLFRLSEGLALNRGLICRNIEPSDAAWGAHGLLLHSGHTTNFSDREITYIYEQFHLLLVQGIIAPGAIGNYGPNLPYFHVTEYGIKCLSTRDVLPYDVDGYLDKIRNILGVDEWLLFYVHEALRCFNANCLEASVIMLGLASEVIINKQISALTSYLGVYAPEKKEEMVNELDKNMNISNKYSIYIKYFDFIKKSITADTFKSLLPQMDKCAMTSYANFVRITRNQLAHPNDTSMERLEVLMIFISFVKYCETQYAFINFFKNN